MMGSELRRSCGIAVLAALSGVALAQPAGDAGPVFVLPDLTAEMPPLTPVFRAPPSYPRRLANRGISGYAVVEFMIETSGEVEGAQVVDSRPQDEFDEVAATAVNQWRYEPQPALVRSAFVELRFASGDSPQPLTLTTPDAFSFVDDLCDGTSVNELCRFLATSPLAPYLRPAHATWGAAVWSGFVVRLADDDGFSSAGGSGPSVRRILGIEPNLGRSLSTAAQEAIRAEREHWAGIEREILCASATSPASADALSRAVNEIHQRRVAEQQRLAGDLLASLDPALAEKVLAFVRGMGDGQMRDYRPHLGGWTEQGVAAVKAVLCPVAQ